MERILTRLAIAIAALLTATVVVIIAIGFLGFAVYLALLEHLSPPSAALVTAGVALLLAGLIILLGRAIGALVRRRARRSGSGGWAGALGSLLGEEFAARAAAHPHSTVVASLLSGFAVGASPDLRHLLRDLFVHG
jgi:hypothetical protein